jgi:REP element-mobilizing transposase RayT
MVAHFPNSSLIILPTLFLAVIERWRQELDTNHSDRDKLLLQSRIERYADQGYGKAFLRDYRLAEMVQETLLNDDGKKYRLSAWVVMPNHDHLLATRFEDEILADIMQVFISVTSHKANQPSGEADNSGCWITLIATSEMRNITRRQSRTLKTTR